MEITFNTPFSRQRVSTEQNSGEILVETAGYVSADKMIQRLINAGIRLADFRAGEFGSDGLPEGEEPSVDPTQSSDFDLSDVSEIMQNMTKPVASTEEPAGNTKKAGDKGETTQVTNVKQNPDT